MFVLVRGSGMSYSGLDVGTTEGDAEEFFGIETGGFSLPGL